MGRYTMSHYNLTGELVIALYMSTHDDANFVCGAMAAIVPEGFDGVVIVAATLSQYWFDGGIKRL